VEFRVINSCVTNRSMRFEDFLFIDLSLKRIGKTKERVVLSSHAYQRHTYPRLLSPFLLPPLSTNSPGRFGPPFPDFRAADRVQHRPPSFCSRHDALRV
jgi:hypothetical protein